MFENYLLPRTIELSPEQDSEYIETAIISILKEQKVSLSQARAIFNHILTKVEDKNLINL